MATNIGLSDLEANSFLTFEESTTNPENPELPLNDEVESELSSAMEESTKNRLFFNYKILSTSQSEDSKIVILLEKPIFSINFFLQNAREQIFFRSCTKVNFAEECFFSKNTIECFFVNEASKASLEFFQIETEFQKKIEENIKIFLVAKDFFSKAIDERIKSKKSVNDCPMQNDPLFNVDTVSYQYSLIQLEEYKSVDRRGLCQQLRSVQNTIERNLKKTTKVNLVYQFFIFKDSLTINIVPERK